MAGHLTVMARQREVFGFSVLFCLNPHNYQRFSAKIDFGRGAQATALSGDNAALTVKVVRQVPEAPPEYSQWLHFDRR
jgi:hypothetical protein